MKLRALIVEDEPLARRTLGELVADVDWLELAGEAASGGDAVFQIDEREPDVVFLDVEMPEFSGLEVLARVKHEPAVVFTTAYDRYAVAAFELGALDYLVKPFGRKRFAAMLERVRERFDAGPGDPELFERARYAFATPPLERLFARKGRGIVPVLVDEITEIHGSGDYSEVLAAGETYLLQVTLAELESRLDPSRFLRVHRSHIVNLDYVSSIDPHDERRYAVTMKDGRTIVCSRSGSMRLKSLAR